MAFRGSTYTLNNPGNRKFLKEVELLAKFGPAMKQHVSRAESGAGSHEIYLGKRIQNELIESISSKIHEQIVYKVKISPNISSIILDCTPDLSNKEQLFVIVPVVSQEDVPYPKLRNFSWVLLL
ncbi:unnamed protein product [Lepeophtheirus salmonis]|uniref:(salmon louse) hypothetical protein n=1 Tax=Lepeophtheirus salmonis TaxID=72036 RepID=A0A7R8D1E5_LEPSM|nr:unnamed protein product [Lepeophtheirus salmonis]CAF2968390.1 unnamed protein product [Lepeophtheirus salmonis]